MKLIIDACTKGSGGGKRHLSEILNEFVKSENIVSKIYIWGPRSLLDILPNHSIIVKNSPRTLNVGLLGSFIWQFFFRDLNFKKIDFDCIYSPYGNYTGALRPYVSMSRNMLMFERNERKKYGYSLQRLKLKFLYFIQKKSFLNSTGFIFLSNYAKKIISKKLRNNFIGSTIINHGISEEFRKPPKFQSPISNYSHSNPFRFLYVSNILPYKYHLNVITAVNQLVENGVPLKLTIVGQESSHKLARKVNNLVNKVNSKNNIIDWHKNITIKQVKSFYHSSDSFIFASSCENMPNILVEAMSSGLPIICSSLGPMKEFLKDSGLYFNPLSVQDLKNKILKMIDDTNLRQKLSTKSYKLSFNYSWEECAKNTISYILETSKNINMFKNKTLLITGGTGSFGNAVLDKFLKTEHFSEIRIFSRDEKKQDDMRNLYKNSKIKFYLGDVRDYSSIERAMRGVDYVFHAAALKQVPSCEFFPLEATKTNVFGTQNTIDAAAANDVKKIICLSTDKAAYPINAMGISKALMEKVAIAASRNYKNTTVCLTRYGNVMASRGSVIPLFINQIKNNQELTITDPNMTRFLMSLDDAVELVLFAFENGNTGDLFVNKATAGTVGDLAQALKEIFNSNNRIKNIGTRHGEKLYETLCTREEMMKAEDMGNFFRIPADNRDLNYDKYFLEGNQTIEVTEDYNSHNTFRSDVKGIKLLLNNLSIIKNKINN